MKEIPAKSGPILQGAAQSQAAQSPFTLHCKKVFKEDIEMKNSRTQLSQAMEAACRLGNDLQKQLPFLSSFS